MRNSLQRPTTASLALNSASQLHRLTAGIVLPVKKVESVIWPPGFEVFPHKGVNNLGLRAARARWGLLVSPSGIHRVPQAQQ